MNMRHLKLIITLIIFLSTWLVMLGQDFHEYLSKGNQEFNNGNFKGAEKYFTSCIKLEPDNYLGYLTRATVEMELKEYEKAIDDFSKLLELKPEYSNAYYQRGLAFSLIDDMSSACIDFKTAVSLLPNNKDLSMIYSEKCYGLQLINIEVEKAFSELLKKGQFENTQMYNKRINAVKENIQVFKDSLYNEFALKEIDLEDLNLFQYDPDNQIYIITHPQLDTIYLQIPPVKAQIIYKNWTDSCFTNPSFLEGINGRIALKSFFINIDNSSTYYQLNKDANLYTIYNNERTSAMKVTTTNLSIKANVKYLALIIGNGLYKYGGSLSNSENDARVMKSSLERLGFDVIEYENLNLDPMRKVIDEFGNRLRDYDVGLFFYAGHGIQAKGNNYLIPIDANLQTENDVVYNCVNVGRVLGEMEDARNNTNIIILDACRDNPFERSWSRSTSGRGLAFMSAPPGSIIAYATAPGSTASDGIGNNGLYTSGLIKFIENPNISLLQIFQQVRKYVRENSNGLQIPWESTSLEGDLYFKK